MSLWGWFLVAGYLQCSVLLLDSAERGRALRSLCDGDDLGAGRWFVFVGGPCSGRYETVSMCGWLWSGLGGLGWAGFGSVETSGC